MSAASSSITSGKRIRQKRSQKTYDTLIETCFELLGSREFKEISIAELALKAGYSVGAFYARFKSKDELFDAMIVQHIEQRKAVRARQFASLTDESLIREIIQETADYYWARRRFWRAALIRSISDSNFWEPIRKISHAFADSLVDRISSRAKRALTAEENSNVRFAVQVVLGTINNTIINQPGPIRMGQAAYVDNLTRALRLISGYDELIAPAPARKRLKKRPQKRG